MPRFRSIELDVNCPTWAIEHESNYQIWRLCSNLTLECLSRCAHLLMGSIHSKHLKLEPYSTVSVISSCWSRVLYAEKGHDSWLPISGAPSSRILSFNSPSLPSSRGGAGDGENSSPSWFHSNTWSPPLVSRQFSFLPSGFRWSDANHNCPTNFSDFLFLGVLVAAPHVFLLLTIRFWTAQRKSWKRHR